jgi:hypothetical protein
LVCPYGITNLRVGSLSIPLYATKNTTRALAVQGTGGVCYADMATGSTIGALNVDINGEIWHTN